MVDTIFPVILYILGSTLLVVLIILGLKLIYTVDKTNEILDDIQSKAKSLDGFFETLNMVSSALSNISDTLSDKFFGLIAKFTRKNKRKRRNFDE